MYNNEKINWEKQKIYNEIINFVIKIAQTPNSGFIRNCEFARLTNHSQEIPS
jgi:hypothetical protein